jgi:uncharacterized coiled-coil DUF342 family protein
MEENTPEKNEKRGSSLIIILFILIGVLAGTTGYFFYQLKTLQKNNEQLVSERSKVMIQVDEYREQLELLTAKYDSLIALHEGIKVELMAEREKVIQLKKEYDAYKRETSGSSFDSPEPGKRSFRERFEELKKTYDNNEALILELKAKNQELTAENFKASKKVEEFTIQNSKLTEENNKLTKTVEVAKRLKTYEIYADAVKVSGGGAKEKQTDKAKKADRIRTCFTLLENTIADKSEKSIYVAITTPDGKILSEGDRSKLTLLNGEEIQYSVRKDIFYDNKTMQLCLNWDTKEALTMGNYTVKIYADGVQIGKESFQLK